MSPPDPERALSELQLSRTAARFLALNLTVTKSVLPNLT